VILVAVKEYGQTVKQLTYQPVIDSGAYRHGFVVAESKQVSAGAYCLIVSTYHRGQVGSFNVDIFTSFKLQYPKQIQ
jgi:hypothetical protein